MKTVMLIREVWLSTISRLVPALMVAILCASMCATTLLTVGRTVSAEAQILAQMEEPKNREIVLIDIPSSGLISSSVISALDTLSIVERSVGLDSPKDMRLGGVGRGAPTIPVWPLVGDITYAVELVAGRMPHPGEALIAKSTVGVLGLDSPASFLALGENEFPIVGFFAARSPFEALETGGIIVAPIGSPAKNLHVIARSPHSVLETQKLTLHVLGNPEPNIVSLQSPVGIAEIHTQISGDFGNFGRQLLLLVLAAGALLTAVVVLSDTLIRRADLGRRRALGASQNTIVLLVVLRTLLAAAFGALVGTIGGIVAAELWSVHIPWTFGVATAALTILSATLASIPPAIFAATRDPVQVLRTP